MKSEKYILPEYWASYLINGDFSGLADGKKEEIDKYLSGIKGNCVDCSEESWYSRTNDANNIGGNVLEYVFLES